jgi:hypothetical protein
MVEIASRYQRMAQIARDAEPPRLASAPFLLQPDSFDMQSAIVLWKPAFPAPTRTLLAQRPVSSLPGLGRR